MTGGWWGAILDSLVATPAAPWLHHSLDRREGQSNYGMNVMLWDHVFDTCILPGSEPHRALGIEPDGVPPPFTGRLTMPWRAVRELLRRT